MEEALKARLREQQYLTDARVQIAFSGLSDLEMVLLAEKIGTKPNTVFHTPHIQQGELVIIPLLLNKGLIKVRGLFVDGRPGYELTPLGRVVADLVKSKYGSLKPAEVLEPAKAMDSESPNEKTI